MRKKQITSPTKITVKQSPMIAKFGPQEVIVSDTSLKYIEENDESPTTNSKWQKNSRSMQERGLQQKSKSPQGLQYNTNWKSMAKSPKQNISKGWKKGEKSSQAEDQANVTGLIKHQNKFGAETTSENKVEDEDANGELVEKQHTFSNGDVYIGTWRGKWIEGYGVYNFNKQNLQYRGQFKKNKQHGMGVLLRKPGGTQTKEEEIYDGEWMNGEKHGLGKYYYFKDVYYDGNWVRNKKQGHGMFKSSEGEYVGEWKNDKKDGRGVLKLKNGHVFEGTWIMNQFLEGTLAHSNGDRYEGEFQNFNRHGYGTYFYSNKSKYRGYWQNNLKHGMGQIQYFNGDGYQGPLVENSRQGNDGIYKWQSGEEIFAEFQKDAPTRGKIRLPSEGESQFNLLK